MLIAHFLRLLFILISSPPANDHAIPSPTTERTPRSSTILITNRISFAKTDWNPARPVGTVHSYFLLVTDHPQARPVGSYSILPSVLVHLIHTQLAPGTTSDVYIRVNPAGVVSSTGGLASRIESDCIGLTGQDVSTDEIAGSIVRDPRSNAVLLVAVSIIADEHG